MFVATSAASLQTQAAAPCAQTIGANSSAEPPARQQKLGRRLGRPKFVQQRHCLKRQRNNVILSGPPRVRPRVLPPCGWNDPNAVFDFAPSGSADFLAPRAGQKHKPSGVVVRASVQLSQESPDFITGQRTLFLFPLGRRFQRVTLHNQAALGGPTDQRPKARGGSQGGRFGAPAVNQQLQFCGANVQCGQRQLVGEYSLNQRPRCCACSQRRAGALFIVRRNDRAEGADAYLSGLAAGDCCPSRLTRVFALRYQEASLLSLSAGLSEPQFLAETDTPAFALHSHVQ